mmetsp:Transcript_7251/g.19648  ORF Transcript_7251/g.19648 Transcript_7251/m.19648 type:complete len:444 (-) Transcript_7251:20-1351(-)
MNRVAVSVVAATFFNNNRSSRSSNSSGSTVALPLDVAIQSAIVVIDPVCVGNVNVATSIDVHIAAAAAVGIHTTITMTIAMAVLTVATLLEGSAAAWQPQLRSRLANLRTALAIPRHQGIVALTLCPVLLTAHVVPHRLRESRDGRLHNVLDEEHDVFPRHHNSKQPGRANLLGQPGKVGVGKAHQPAVGQDCNDGDDVQEVLPDAHATSLLRQWSASHLADLVGIEPHAEQAVHQAEEWDQRHHDAEACHEGELDHGGHVLGKARMRRVHDLEPNVVLCLIQQDPLVDELDFTSLLRLLGLEILRCIFRALDLPEGPPEHAIVEESPNLTDQHEEVHLQKDLEPMRHRGVDQKTRSHSHDSVPDALVAADGQVRVVVHRSELTHESEGKHLDDQRCSVFRLGAVVLEVVEHDGHVHEDEVEDRDAQTEGDWERPHQQPYSAI